MIRSGWMLPHLNKASKSGLEFCAFSVTAAWLHQGHMPGHQSQKRKQLFLPHEGTKINSYCFHFGSSRWNTRERGFFSPETGIDDQDAGSHALAVAQVASHTVCFCTTVGAFTGGTKSQRTRVCVCVCYCRARPAVTSLDRRVWPSNVLDFTVGWVICLRKAEIKDKHRTVEYWKCWNRRQRAEELFLPDCSAEMTTNINKL